MIRIGITGGAGYVAGELLRLLLSHPEAEIRFVWSRSHGGELLAQVHHDLAGDTDLRFVGDYPEGEEIDLLFLCSGHGTSKSFLDENAVAATTRVIDMSADFRLSEGNSYKGRHFLYGLPELHRNQIAGADSIANPGCFATAIQLALLPLASAGCLNHPVHVNGITGATGAGATLSPTTHFAWRDGNISIYKPFTHQHLDEIRESLGELQPNFPSPIHFIPVRGNFSRGIFASVYTECGLDVEAVKEIYREYYADHPFTILTDSSPSLKSVVNTNKCLLHLTKHEDQVLIVSTIDNLLKGASGQAVQNMNLMFGLNEKTGLQLKGTGF
ncbi:MAG: N-acetyl-gamma-glutamyl-phosphate reductase [Ignavibacteriae bacterium]|nr:N-acetyl-gamma-glutamyl-phosphate reductase [Ignavibacteriota bacterium]MCB9215408.1 N-acetyl-gamma-glutamyl-phosphate reductase [Ignavibacteria bacterium]